MRCQQQTIIRVVLACLTLIQPLKELSASSEWVFQRSAGRVSTPGPMIVFRAQAISAASEVIGQPYDRVGKIGVMSAAGARSYWARVRAQTLVCIVVGVLLSWLFLRSGSYRDEFFSSSWFDEARASREYQKEAYRRIVADDLEKWVRQGAPILEVGSGEGALADWMAPDQRDRLLQTDRDDQALARNPAPPDRKAVVDAQKMPYASGTIPAIVSLCVLDALPDLEAALREFSRVLSPEGVVISIHDFGVVPGPSVLYWRLRRGVTMIPIVAEQKYVLVSMAVLSRQLAAAPRSEVLERMTVLLDDPLYLLMRPDLFHPLSIPEALKAVSVPYESMDQFEMFSKRLKAMAEETGLVPLSFERVSRTVLVDRDQVPGLRGRDNFIDSDGYPGKGSAGFSDQIPLGKARVNGTLMIYRFQKPPASASPRRSA